MLAYVKLVKRQFGVNTEYELHITSIKTTSVLRLTPQQAERLILDGVPVEG